MAKFLTRKDIIKMVQDALNPPPVTPEKSDVVRALIETAQKKRQAG